MSLDPDKLTVTIDCHMNNLDNHIIWEQKPTAIQQIPAWEKQCEDNKDSVNRIVENLVSFT